MKLKMKKTIMAFVASLAAASLMLGGCTEEKAGAPEVDEGVVFEFSMHKVYEMDIDAIDEIAAVKITLVRDGERIELPTMNVSGSAEFVQTEPCPLSPGEYRFVNYKAYAADASFMFEVDVDQENTFSVAAGEITHFPIPVSVKIVNYPTNYLKNIFSGFCQEVWGDDETLWPWDFEEDIADWDFVEFEYDDYGNPTALVGLTFCGTHTILHEDGSVETEQTPFLSMTRIPDCINRIETLYHLTITDLPNLKELPSGLDKLRYLDAVLIQNTGVEQLPEDMFGADEIFSLIVTDSPLKEFPAGVSQLSKLNNLVIRNTDITSINASLGGLAELAYVDFSHNAGLASINDDIFAGSSSLNFLSLAGDTALSSFPSSAADVQIESFGLDLSGCGLSSLPENVLHPGITSLYLDDNSFTSVIPLDGFSRIETLTMNGNPISGRQSVSSSTLQMLELSRCSLSEMPDVSGCQELRVLELNENSFTSIPSIDFASSNRKMRRLSLSGNTSLVSLPDAGDFTLYMDNGKVADFAALYLDDCPALTWTVPAAWNPVDLPETLDPESLSPDVDGAATKADVDDAFTYEGRVGVSRRGSPGVTF